MRKRIISVVGARPNFMKIAPIDRAFAEYPGLFEHLIVHTGQHYDEKMSDSFFRELEMPQPARFLGIGSGSHGEQTGKIIIEFEKICNELKPDLVLVAGDVNSTVAAALAAVKCGIKTGHIEGGLRSFDRTMPEEINRIATDAICDWCFVTEESGLENLRKENFPEQNIFFVGNTMIDSLFNAMEKAKKSKILKELELEPKNYVAVTMHRPSNVDQPERLGMILDVFDYLSANRKIVFPVHPRTRKNFELFSLGSRIQKNPNIILIDALAYTDFLSLVNNCDFVLTDSGGIQEETTALGISCLTLRTTTERPITCRLGTNILINPEKEFIINAIDDLLRKPRKVGSIPPLWDGKAAQRIVEIIKNL
ncbi:MAG: UDP-N-acetylglucosamine 2-epimerase (non-hydrolyzing) [Ignavibacteria bacterium]|nr:UDP-N-acetylglucosamine 2-epimerase (non-hydrolyzing) [Ignavibacteria bacterium]